MHGTLNPPRLSPQDAARWQKAQEQLLAGRSGPALAGYRQLAARHPNLPLLWFELGNAASAALDFKQADAAYQRALQLAPQDASLLGMIGHQYLGLRQLDQARACFERAVMAAPGPGGCAHQSGRLV